MNQSRPRWLPRDGAGSASGASGGGGAPLGSGPSFIGGPGGSRSIGSTLRAETMLGRSFLRCGRRGIAPWLEVARCAKHDDRLAVLVFRRRLDLVSRQFERDAGALAVRASKV